MCCWNADWWRTERTIHGAASATRSSSDEERQTGDGPAVGAEAPGDVADGRARRDRLAVAPDLVELERDAHSSAKAPATRGAGLDRRLR